MTHAKEDDQLLLGASDRLELLATIIMALAAIATAWCAFQATKWSGIQAIEFSNANAERIESTRSSNTAGQQTAIDIGLFTEWLNAISDELRAGEIELGPGMPYEPTPGTLSTFYYERMRGEFKPALEAWLNTEPLANPSAPPSPFAMDEYQLAAAQRAEDLLGQAAQDRQDALDANQNGDNYVLTTVLFALVIFFGGVSNKLAARRNRWIAMGIALALFAGGLFAVFSLPIVAPF